MKKLIATLCCIIVGTMCVALTGCGQPDGQYSDSKYLGKWTATEVEVNGVTSPIGDYLDQEFSITLNADGSTSIVNNGEKNVGVWTPTNDGFEIDKGSSTFIDNGDDTVVLEYDGLTFTFEK